MPAYLNTNSTIKIDSTSDVINKASNVNQLIDIIGVDVASHDGSSDTNTRKSYEVFTTGSAGQNTSAIASSLFQTVFDQDFTYQTSNELLDVAIGLYKESKEVTNTSTSTDSSGKLIFPDTVLMMREKINIYKQYAQYLLGDSEAYFTKPWESELTASTGNPERIDAAVFINIKRLFTRDAIKKDTFAINILKDRNTTLNDSLTLAGQTPTIYSDSGALTNHRVSTYCGSVSSLKDSSNNDVGLIFYEKGILVLDAKEIFDYQKFSTNPTDSKLVTSINNSHDFEKNRDFQVLTVGDTTLAQWQELGLDSTATEVSVGDTFTTPSTIPDTSAYDNNGAGTAGTVYPIDDNSILKGSIQAVTGTSDGLLTFENNLRHLFISGSCDDVINHICSTRFSRDNKTCIAFQNKTVINSSLIFCRAAPSQANYSSNPTYTDSNGNIRVISDENSDPFSYVTTVGLYSGTGDLVAVAKTSRPIEKNPETDLSIRIRLDY